MHRHGYKGTKFGRERDQRRSLLKSLADSLILRESIETSLPKAKAVARYTEALITVAKKGDLHNRRQVIKGLSTKEAAHKLVDEISPKLLSRSSGYLRVVRTNTRRGDGVQLARVGFVDDLKKKSDRAAILSKIGPKKTDGLSKSEQQTVAAKPVVSAPTGKQKIQVKTSSKATARRTGRRGNR